MKKAMQVSILSGAFSESIDESFLWYRGIYLLGIFIKAYWVRFYGFFIYQYPLSVGKCLKTGSEIWIFFLFSKTYFIYFCNLSVAMYDFSR